jgi:glutamine amidotransferase
VQAVSTPDDLVRADGIILPGVGAFDRAMLRLRESGMQDVLAERVLGKRVPLLGICVGMQMMAERSSEGTLPGLGWIPGEVRKLSARQPHDRIALPHMGWNDVRPHRTGDLFRKLEADARFYFLHSYYFAPRDSAHVLASTDYHGEYASGVSAGNVFGVQFHPEKSHHWGIQLLKNFAEM